MPKLFVDLDGVLADFDTGYELAFGIRPSKSDDNVNWAAVRAYPNFYQTLPPMPDMPELWAFVQPFNPIILTGVPKSIREASYNKRDWVEKNLGSHVEVRCCLSKEKCLHAEPGDILIDDWIKYKHLWEERKGIWITHTSAADIIQQLKKLQNA